MENQINLIDVLKRTYPDNSIDFKSSLTKLIDTLRIPEKITNLTYNTNIIFELFSEMPREAFVDESIFKFIDLLNRFINPEPGKSKPGLNGLFSLHGDKSRRSAFSKKDHPLYYQINQARNNWHTEDGRKVLLFALIICAINEQPTANATIETLFNDKTIQTFLLLTQKHPDSNLLSRFKKTANLLLESTDQNLKLYKPIFSKALKVLNSYHSNDEFSPDVKPPKPKTRKPKEDHPHIFVTPAEDQTGRLLDVIGPRTRPGHIITPEPDTEHVLPGESLYEDTPDIEIYPEEIIDGTPTSRARSRHAAGEKRMLNALGAQFLRTDWNRLSEVELSILTDSSLHQLELKGEFALQAFSTLMTLTTGAEPLFWCHWPINEDEQDCYVNIDKGVFVHPIKVDGGFWEPSIDQESKLHKTSSLVELPIEKRLLDFINALEPTAGQTLAEVLKIEPDALHEMTSEWIKSLFKDYSRWFDIARIRTFLHHNVMTLTMDPTLASHICAQPVYKPPASNTYAAIDSCALVKTYIEALPDQLNFDHYTGEPYLIGSRLQIRFDYLRDFLHIRRVAYQLAKSQISAKSKLTDIVKCHNLFVDYFCLVNFIQTSHRPQIDPWPRHNDFLEELNAVIVTDKVIGAHNESRLSYHGRITRELRLYYEQHLKALGFWFAHFDYPIEAAKVASLITPMTERNYLPYLFYIEQGAHSLKFVSVSKTQLESRMPDFQLPWNFGRHLRASFFRKMQVPAEYIAYDFGHISHGEQPFGNYSILRPRDVERVISPVLDTLSEELDIAIIEQMPFKQKRLSLPPMTMLENAPAFELGFEKRAQRRKQKQASDKQIIKDIQAKFLDDNNPTALTEASLEKALTQLYQRSPVNLIQTINLFSRLVNAFVRKHNLKLRPLTRIIELKSEASTFSPSSTLLIEQGLHLRAHFIYKVLKTPVSGNKIERLKNVLGRFLVSLYLLNLISDQKILKGLILALKEQDYLWHDRQHYINLRHQGEVYRRVPIDPISASLFYQASTLIKPYFADKMFELEQVEKNIAEIFQGALGVSVDLKNLGEITGELAKIEFPGFLRAINSGELPIASVDEVSWVRLHDDVRVQRESRYDDTENESEKLSRQIHLIRDIKKYRTTKADLRQAYRDRKVLTSVLTENHLMSREEAVKTLRSYFETFKSRGAMQITLLLCHWLIDTINRPGKRVSRLRHSTIANSFKQVARFMTEEFGAYNLFDMEPDELEHGYQRIVSLAENNQSKRKTALESFHDFLCRQYKFKPLASSLDAQNIDNPSSVDANFLSEQERAHIMVYLANPFKPEISREYQLIFTLYFRLGLRVSEIFKISFKDVQLADCRFESCIIMKNNHLGKLKNKASKRLIYLDLLTDSEFLEFKTWFDQQPKSNLNAPIWTTPIEEAQDKIAKALKSVTGDTRLSVRNLRHGVPSHFLNQNLVKDGYQNQYADLFEKNFGTGYPTRRTLYYLARTLGHGGPSTTLFHYANFYEPILACTHYQPSLTSYELLGIAADSNMPRIRQWIKRAQPTEPSQAVLDRLYHNDSSYLKVVNRCMHSDQARPIQNDLIDLYDALSGGEQAFKDYLKDKSEQEMDVYIQRLKSMALRKGITEFLWLLPKSYYTKKADNVIVKINTQIHENAKYPHYFLNACLLQISKITHNDQSIFAAWKENLMDFCPCGLPYAQSLIELGRSLGLGVVWGADRPEDFKNLEVIESSGLSLKKIEGGTKKPLIEGVHPDLIGKQPSLVFFDEGGRCVNSLLSISLFLLWVKLIRSQSLEEENHN
ncbi:MAG: hypothetical protein IBX55_19145 [Methyloprofundus sp.]|nr:hypothetical protein [Methyloprofundus sp.]